MFLFCCFPLLKDQSTSEASVTGS